jgi:spore maturation protein CgeB
MRCHLADLVHDTALRAELVQHGLAAIRARHTCAHRVDELMTILQSLETKLVTA